MLSSERTAAKSWPLTKYLLARRNILISVVTLSSVATFVLWLDNISWAIMLDIGIALAPIVLVVAALDCRTWVHHYRAITQLPHEFTADAIARAELLPGTTDPLALAYRLQLASLATHAEQLAGANATATATLSEHFAIWSHQMKTPLAALDLLLQVEPVNVLAAREEVRKIDRYVQMMLTYVRLNDVNSDLALTAVDLNVLVRSVVRELAQLFIGKDLRVQVDDLPTVTSDARWLRFICEQLLTNAAKYTERGGVHVSFTDGALIIADTGIGILPQDLPRLFDRGFSGFNGHANQKATGLGLYMSQTIAKKLGSSLTVTSAVGTGTTVKLSFDQTAWTPE